MSTQSRVPCRSPSCNKTFSDDANERKHVRKKHPLLIGTAGIPLVRTEIGAEIQVTFAVNPC